MLSEFKLTAMTCVLGKRIVVVYDGSLLFFSSSSSSSAPRMTRMLSQVTGTAMLQSSMRYCWQRKHMRMITGRHTLVLPLSLHTFSSTSLSLLTPPLPPSLPPYLSRSLLSLLTPFSHSHSHQPCSLPPSSLPHPVTSKKTLETVT